MTNAADPEAVKKQKQKAKAIADRQEDELRTLLKLPEFRRYVWRHMNETCGLLKSPASGNGSVQSQNIGMQDAARIIWAEIESVEPEAIPQMMVEYSKRDQLEEKK